jgi:hypothetical protein
MIAVYVEERLQCVDNDPGSCRLHAADRLQMGLLDSFANLIISSQACLQAIVTWILHLVRSQEEVMPLEVWQGIPYHTSPSDSSVLWTDSRWQESGGAAAVGAASTGRG